MVSIEEVRAARKKVSEASAALLPYAERPSSEPANPAKHHRLADELQRANDEFMRLIHELAPTTK